MDSSGMKSNSRAPQTWGEYLRAGIARRDRPRMLSYVLMGAMLVVILLGVQMVYVFEDPRRPANSE